MGGLDVSEAMLVQARKNTAHLDSDLLLRRADYRNLSQHIKRSFDVVTCLGSTGDMLDGKQFLRSIRSMNAVLREGGILVMTTNPTDKTWLPAEGDALDGPPKGWVK